MKKFNIAMIGCGGVSGMHFDGYSAQPERVKIVAACDPNPDQLAKAREKYGNFPGFATVGEMIKGASWEVAVVCTPTSVREAVVAELAAAGKHIFVEKPFADTIAEARRMVQVCDRAGVRVSVNQNFRYHSPFYLAKEQIMRGRIGRPLQIIQISTQYRKDTGWRLEQERHALSVMGVHWFDGFRWMLGTEAESIYCRTGRSAALGCRGETDASSIVRFPGGAIATCLQSFSCMQWGNDFRVIGEQGMLQETGAGLAVFTKPGNTPDETLPNPYSGAGKPLSAFRQLDELLTAIETNSAAPNSGADNLHTIQLLDAAYDSAATGAVVSLSGSQE